VIDNSEPDRPSRIIIDGLVKGPVAPRVIEGEALPLVDAERNPE
jgi:hypothetical protein